MPVLILVFFSWMAHADLKDLAAEYLQNNAQIQRRTSEIKMLQLDVNRLQATRTWGLGYETTYADSKLEAQFAFIAPPTKTQNHTLSLTRGFDWGGTFSLDHSFRKVRENGTNTSSNGQNFSAFSQGISYTQELGKNLFGRTFKMDVNLLEGERDFQSAKHQEFLLTGLEQLGNSYSSARLYKSMIALQTKAFERAKRRHDFVQRRVKDGLREKVELFQSEMALASSKEEIEKAKINYNSSLGNLSANIHRTIKNDEILRFYLRERESLVVPSGRIEENGLIKSRDERIEVLNDSLKRDKFQKIPTLSLKAGYKVNEFDRKTNKAIDDGLLTGDNSEASIALNLDWRIGSGPEKIDVAKRMVDLESTKKLKEKDFENLGIAEANLKERLEGLSKNINSVRKRVRLAEKALVEMNKLYRRGRSNLDQVIRAEEDLINTQLNYIQYRLEQDGLNYALAKLYGNLHQYLIE